MAQVEVKSEQGARTGAQFLDGLGQNLCGYIRIPEEDCFAELYCDMEQLEPEHQPRRWPDDRFSSNTWGPLPPRSYFRFDAEAIATERESLEMIA